MTTATKTSPEERPPHARARPAARRLVDGLHDADVHDNAALELDASDPGGGNRGGGPTTPTAAAVASAPSRQPTLRREPSSLRGVVWYDRNGNGRRDPNVEVAGMGNDVEYSHGVSGVAVELVRCDDATGRAYATDAGETLEKAAAISQGFDARMKHKVVPTNGQNGKYSLPISGPERWYYVQADAPEGFLFTAGICNDEEKGWECDYSAAVEAREPANPTRLRRVSEFEAGARPYSSLGINSGRSTSCVYVDGNGNAQNSINFGVVRISEIQEVSADATLLLEFDDIDVDPNRRSRRLGSVLRRAKVIDVVDDGLTVTTFYLLGGQEKAAIGTIAAEVLAVTLGRDMAENGLTLDAVNSKEVILSTTGPSDRPASASSSNIRARNRLAVTTEIKGHYLKDITPPSRDLDYIIQDSINRDAVAIRRGLREYNSNCRGQQSKVNDLGLEEEDFDAVVSTKGILGSGHDKDIASLDNVFSKACSSGFLAPVYFETHLADVQLGKASEAKPWVKHKWNGGDDIISTTEAVALDSWAIGSVAVVTGLILLLTGLLVFRRALGRRSAGKYSKSSNAKNVGKDEMLPLGTAASEDVPPVK